jgi:hypothetical protein
MSNTHPTTCGVSGCIGTIIGYEDYYFKTKRVLCTCIFSITAIATTINNDASPLGSTKLDDETGHNCKMSKEIYTSFGLLVLGLDHDSWATARTECAFHNLLIQDINAMMYYWDTDNYVNGAPVLLPDDRLDMACILARLTLLLNGADTCTPHIINSVWGDNKNACLTLGGPQGDLFLIRRKILTLSKVAINMVHIWMTNPSMNFLAPNSPSFQQLPPTVQRLLLQMSKKIVYAREPVPPGTPTSQLLTNNLRQYLVPITLLFKEKAICWYRELLLHHDKADDMTGFDNEIIITYGMCPPCKLQEYYQLAVENCPTHFMQGTAAKIWGDDMHKVMYMSAADWTD